MVQNMGLFLKRSTLYIIRQSQQNPTEYNFFLNNQRKSETQNDVIHLVSGPQGEDGVYKNHTQTIVTQQEEVKHGQILSKGRNDKWSGHFGHYRFGHWSLAFGQATSGAHRSTEEPSKSTTKLLPSTGRSESCYKLNGL